MFCKKCGRIIDDDSVFCYKCGTKVLCESSNPINSASELYDSNVYSTNEPTINVGSENTPANIYAETENNMEKAENICRRITYDSLGKKSLIIYLISAVIGLLWAINTLSEIGSSSYYDNQRMLAYFLIVLSIVEAFIASIKYSNYKKRFVNIYDTYICGIGPGSTDFTSEKFEIQYKDIVKLEKGDMMKTITIYAESTKQTLPFESKELDDVFCLIESLVENSQKSQ